MNDIKIHKRKERDLARILRFFTGYFLMVGVLLAICILTGMKVFTFKHVFIFAIPCIPLALVYVYVVEKLGSGVGALLTGWRSSRFTDREALSGDLGMAKYHKRDGNYEVALKIISKVLEKDSNYPEALYVKAEILWEGFGRLAEAKICVKKVLREVPYEQTLHQWASSLYDKLIKSEKERVNDQNKKQP
jgi:tetratricopeptide (TPR) repeat protein